MGSPKKEQQLMKPKDLDDEKKIYPLMFSMRFWLAIISFVGFINLYALRINIAVAVVCMVNHTAVKMDVEMVSSLENGHNETTYTTDEGPKCHATSGNATAIKDGDFNWSKELQGVILGSFFYGYIFTQFPGGYISGRFGGKRVMGWCMFVAAVATLVTPLGSRVSPYFLIFLRVLVGLGEGVVFPSMNSIWANWAPPLERSKLVGFTLAGAPMGNVVAFPISGVLCSYGFDGGWPSIFYVFGIFGLLWFIAWMLLVSDSPGQHRHISDAEREYITSSIGVSEETAARRKALGTPWRAIFTSVPVWSLIISHMCANWGLFTLLTTMPTYMKEVLKFDIASNGALSAVPYIAFWACINIAGNTADFMRSRGVRTVVVRKMCMSIGTILPGVFLVATGFITCATPYIAVTLLTLSVGFSGFQYAACFVNQLDIAPQFAGIIFGISNTAAAIPGFLGPYAVGRLTKHQTQQEWQTVFYISGVIYAMSALIYALGTAGEVQPWAEPYLDKKVAKKEDPELAQAIPLTEMPSGEVKELPSHKDLLLNAVHSQPSSTA